MDSLPTVFLFKIMNKIFEFIETFVNLQTYKRETLNLKETIMDKNELGKLMMQAMAAQEGHAILAIFEEFTSGISGGRKLDEAIVAEMADNKRHLEALNEVFQGGFLQKLNGDKPNKAVALLKELLAMAPSRVDRVAVMLKVIGGVLLKEQPDVAQGGIKEQKALIIIGGTIGDINALLLEELATV